MGVGVEAEQEAAQGAEAAGEAVEGAAGARTGVDGLDWPGQRQESSDKGT